MKKEFYTSFHLASVSSLVPGSYQEEALVLAVIDLIANDNLIAGISFFTGRE